MEKKREEIHTYVARGRDVSLGIHKLVWVLFHKEEYIYYRRRWYIIEGEDKNKEKPITYKTLFM